MASLGSKIENKISQNQLTPGSDSFMVGILFKDGVLLLSNMSGNLIYYLTDRIYCCASNSGFDRDAQLEVASKLEDVCRANDYKGATVSQSLELLSKKYDQAKNSKLLLAGVDAQGMHLYTLKSWGKPKILKYAAFGADVDEANKYLNQQWQPDMELGQAEQLVRRTAQMAKVDMLQVEICVVFKQKEKKRIWQ